MNVPNKIVFVFFTLFLGMIFSQCKKYPEDDVFIQWKKPEKRLIKCGPWVFDKLTVDGVDKSAEFRADSAYFDKIEFKEHESGATDIRIMRNNVFDERGLYEFSGNKEILKMSAFSHSFTDIANYGPVFIIDYVEWEILRLSKKGMTLKTTNNSSEYILMLSSQN